jgi:short-subunit dehydrogenase
MTDVKFTSALIVGAGSGLSASLARALASEGIKVALAARSTGDLDALVKETGAHAFACDAAERAQVEKLFADVDASVGAPDIVIYNASFRTRGPFVELVKGYPQSAPFAMGKFALRGLAQSMARELSPQGIHVAHVVVDGGIRSAHRSDPADRPDSTLDPDAIAESYMHLIHQPRSAWAWEIELRPWVEKF